MRIFYQYFGDLKTKTIIADDCMYVEALEYQLRVLEKCC